MSKEKEAIDAEIKEEIRNASKIDIHDFEVIFDSIFEPFFNKRVRKNEGK